MDKRLIYIDIAKGVAIFLVVFGHTMQYIADNEGIIFKIIDLFHMPFFFMLSGLSLIHI